MTRFHGFHPPCGESPARSTPAAFPARSPRFPAKRPPKRGESTRSAALRTASAGAFRAFRGREPRQIASARGEEKRRQTGRRRRSWNPGTKRSSRGSPGEAVLPPQSTARSPRFPVSPIAGIVFRTRRSIPPNRETSTTSHPRGNPTCHMRSSRSPAGMPSSSRSAGLSGVVTSSPSAQSDPFPAGLRWMGAGELAGSGWREKSGTPMARSWRSSDQSESMKSMESSESSESSESLPEHNCFWRNRRNREQLAEAPAGSSSLEQKHNSFRRT